MPNEVSIARHPGMPFSDLERLGEYIAKSNLFGIKTKEQAIVLMAIAQAEGRHPVEAARDYDIVNNRPAKKAEAMLRDFIQAGGKVQWHALTDELADATFTHPQTGEVRIDWDMKRAQTAFGKKDMYAKFPRQMLRSRVVSEGVRTLWPLATSGMYEPGEQADIQAKDEHTGPTIESDTRDALNDTVPLKAAAAATPRGARIAERAPAYEAPPKPERTDDQWRAWLEKLGQACATLYSREELNDLADKATVGDAIATGPEWVQRDISAILDKNYRRFGGEPALDLDIVGEKYAAG
jgi:hypothetical protein